MEKKELIEKVIMIINEVDPFGLVDSEIEESKNEYQGEARIIAETVERGLSIEKLKEKVKKIFIDKFGDESLSRVQRYEKIADLLRSNNLL